MNIPEGYEVDPSKCAKCLTKSLVVDSRSPKLSPDGIVAVWRRRKCLSCGDRWTTYESREDAHPPDVDVDALRAEVERLRNIHVSIRERAGEALRPSRRIAE